MKRLFDNVKVPKIFPHNVPHNVLRRSKEHTPLYTSWPKWLPQEGCFQLRKTKDDLFDPSFSLKNFSTPLC